MVMRERDQNTVGGKLALTTEDAILSECRSESFNCGATIIQE